MTTRPQEHGPLIGAAAPAVEHSLAYKAWQNGLTEDEMWNLLDRDERLDVILSQFTPAQWFEERALVICATFREQPRKWYALKAQAKKRGVDVFGLEKAVDDVLAMVKRAQARQNPTASGPDPAQPKATPLVVTMADVQAQHVRWLWWPYIAIGKLGMFDGDPGIGKSLLMIQIAASLSRGYPLPDQQGKPTLPTGGPQTTLLLSTEDGLADTIKPRLEAAEADCHRVHVLTGWLGAEDEFHAFTLQHMGVLEDAIKRYQPRLVGIDPIQAYLGKIDMHRANETRPLLAALTRLAERYDCAIVCIRHPSKPGQGSGKVIHRGLGSVDFIGAARTGIFVEQHPTDPGKVLLAQSKSNIGIIGRTQVFTKYEGAFQWCCVSRLSAELMAGSGRGPDPHAFLEAVCWLEEALRDGIPLPSDDLKTKAEEEGIAYRTLQRAKKALGIRSIKRSGEKDKWDWQLPSIAIISPPEQVLSPTLSQQPGSLDSLGSLGSLGTLQENQQVIGIGSSEAGSMVEDDHLCQERAATPKFEAKRHGASDHSNNCRLVPLANILPQTLQALLTPSMSRTPREPSSERRASR